MTKLFIKSNGKAEILNGNAEKTISITAQANDEFQIIQNDEVINPTAKMIGDDLYIYTTSTDFPEFIITNYQESSAVFSGFIPENAFTESFVEQSATAEIKASQTATTLSAKENSNTGIFVGAGLAALAGVALAAGGDSSNEDSLSNNQENIANQNNNNQVATNTENGSGNNANNIASSNANSGSNNSNTGNNNNASSSAANNGNINNANSSAGNQTNPITSNQVHIKHMQFELNQFELELNDGEVAKEILLIAPEESTTVTVNTDNTDAINTAAANLNKAKARVENKENDLMQAKENLQELENNIANAKDSLQDKQSALSNQENLFNQAEKNLADEKQKIADIQEKFDKAVNKNSQAENELDKAEQDVKSSQELLDSANAQLENAQKYLQEIQANSSPASNSSYTVESAKTAKKDGAFAFFEAMNSKDALEIITNPTGKLKGHTHRGDATDATSLDSMLKGLDYIDEINAYRASKGLEALKVSDNLMAVAQAQVNWSCDAVITRHSHSYNVRENLQWGTKGVPFDPVKLWKASVGHNATMLDANMTVAGFAITDGILNTYKAATFSSPAMEIGAYYLLGVGEKVNIPIGQTYTVYEYRARLKKWISQLDDVIDGKDIVDNSAELASASAQVNKAKQKVEQAKKDLEEDQQQLNAAQNNVQNAKQDLANAQKDLDSVNSGVEKAQQDLSAAQSELDILKTDLAQAQNKLNSLQNDIHKAKSEINTAENNLSQAQKDLQEASAQLQSAQNGNSSKVLTKKADEEIIADEQNASELSVKIFASEQTANGVYKIEINNPDGSITNKDVFNYTGVSSISDDKSLFLDSDYLSESLLQKAFSAKNDVLIVGGEYKNANSEILGNINTKQHLDFASGDDVLVVYGKVENADIELSSGDDGVYIGELSQDAKIDGGEGTDTFAIILDNMQLDISQLNISNFEHIDLTEASNLTLVGLSSAVIANNHDSNAVLTITGDAGDKVQLNATDFSAHGRKTIHDSEFYSYSLNTNPEFEILISTDITII